VPGIGPKRLEQLPDLVVPGEERSSVDLAGHSYGIFQKAIQRRNVVAAVAARELPQLSLDRRARADAAGRAEDLAELER
jgi:hypothetical protein